MIDLIRLARDRCDSPLGDPYVRLSNVRIALDAALAAAASGGDVQQAPGEAPQSGGRKPVTPKSGQ